MLCFALLPMLVPFAPIGPMSAQSSPPSGGLVTLDAAFRLAKPLGFAVSASPTEDTRAWLAEGSSITVFDLTASDASIVDAIPVEALALRLLPDEASTDERLFLAGGSAGLVKVEKVAGAWVQTVLDDGRAGVCSYPGDRWCTDVGLIRIQGTVYLVASYAARGDASASCNALRLYDLQAARSAPAPLAPTLDVPLLVGPATSSWPLAWRFAVQEDRDEIYVAVGTEGLVRVGVTGGGGGLSASVSSPFAIPLASLPYAGTLMLDADPPFPDDQARFLDVAVTGNAIYAAADAAGLVQIPYGAFPPASWERYSPGAASNDVLGTYAVNVAVVEQAGTSARVAVAGNKRTSQHAHGMPFTPFGIMSAHGDVGGELSAPASFDAIVLYRESSASLLVPHVDAFPDPPTATYGLELRALGSSEYLVYSDELVRYRIDLAGPDERAAFDGRRGNVTTDGLALVGDPNVMIFGQDGGAKFRGALAFDSVAGTIAAVPNTRYSEDDSATESCPGQCGLPGKHKFPSAFVGGIWAGTQWTAGDDPAFQWMCQGKGETFVRCSGPQDACDWEDQPGGAFELSRFDPDAVDGGGWGLAWWQVPTPVDDDGRRGGSYYGAHHDPVSDLVFFVRGVSRWGLMVTPRSVAESGHTGGLANGALLPAPRQIATHVDDFQATFTQGGPATFNARAFDWSPGGGVPSERVLAVTTSYSGPGASPGFGHAKLTFFRMSSILAGVPELDKVVAFGPPDGNAAAVALADLDPGGGDDPRTFAFVSDHGGRLLVFDLEHLFATPEIAQPSAVFELPVSKLDGHRENLMDLELVWRGDTLYAYLSTWRRGLTIVDVTDPLSPFEIARSPIRFPGICQGLALRRDPGVSQPVATDPEGVPVTHLIATDHFTSARVYSW